MLAQSAAGIGIWDYNMRTGEVAISGEYAKFYGLPSDDTCFTHQEWLKLIHPDDRERIQAVVRESIAGAHV